MTILATKATASATEPSVEVVMGILYKNRQFRV